MKLTTAILILALFCTAAATGQETMYANSGRDVTSLYRESAPGQFTYDAGVGLMSKYIWRGVNLNDDFVIQPDLAVHYGRLTGVIWASFDTTDEANNADNEFNEFRYQLQYGKALDNMDVIAGYIYYDYPNTNKEETQELFASATLSDVVFKPTFSLYFDFDEVDGVWGSVSGSYSESTEEMIWRLDASLGFGSGSFNDYYFGVDGSGITDLTVSISTDFMLYQEVTVTPFVGWTILIDGDIKDASEDDSIFYGGARLSFSF